MNYGFFGKLVPLVFVSVVLLGGCQPASQSSQDYVGPVEVTPDTSTNSSIQDLLTMGKAQRCSFVMESEGTVTKGVVYIDKKRFRNELSVQSQGGDESINYMIGDGEAYYWWQKDNLQGTKMVVAELPPTQQQATESPEVVTDTGESMVGNLATNYTYDCQNWSVDESFFVVPTTVTFLDLGKQAGELQQQADEVLESACAICSKLPESTRQSCLENCQ